MRTYSRPSSSRFATEVRISRIASHSLQPSERDSTMAFSPATVRNEHPSEDALTQDMAGIGMNFAAHANLSAPIEETLVHACRLAMDEHDLRVLSGLTTWLDVHRRYVNADRLVRCISNISCIRVRAYWATVSAWFAKDRRFARLKKLHTQPPLPLLPVGNDFQIERRGEDDRFVGTALRVPAGTLRDRAADVLSPKVLVTRHATYRARVLMGASWRADVWAALEADPNMSVADSARKVGCSFATAWQVVQDFRLFHEGGCL